MNIRNHRLENEVEPRAAWQNLGYGPNWVPGGFFRDFLKRSLDFTIALAMLVLVLWWLLPLLSLLVLIIEGRPVFFVQERVGHRNRLFRCYKIRTMRFDRPPEEAPISPFGKFLRDKKLDELPQFINVLVGEMSVVGPRPHMLRDHEVFAASFGPGYHQRHAVKPGLTGLAQVRGYDGPITSRRKLKVRIRLDLLYIRKWSIFLDLWIVGQTARYLFRCLTMKNVND